MKMFLGLLVLVSSTMAQAQTDLCGKLAAGYADRCQIVDGGRNLEITGLDGTKVKVDTAAADVCAYMGPVQGHCVKTLIINPRLTATDIGRVYRSSVSNNSLDLGLLAEGLDRLAKQAY